MELFILSALTGSIGHVVFWAISKIKENRPALSEARQRA
jgi:hypothetical protein